MVNFTHAKIVFTVTKGNQKNTTESTYTIPEGGEVQGKDTYLVDFTLAHDGQAQSVRMWVTKDLKTVLKVELPDGTTIEGPTADNVGKALLHTVDSLISTTTLATGYTLRITGDTLPKF